MKIPLCLYAAVHASFMAGHYCDYDGMQSVSGCGENHRLIRGIPVSANAERWYSSVCDAYAFCVSCPARKRFHCSFYRHSRSLNVVLSGSPAAGVYPWTASYLLLTGTLSQSGVSSAPGGLIILLVYASGICASIIRFQKEDIT